MMNMLPKWSMRRDPSLKSCKKFEQTPIISLPDLMYTASLKKIYNTNKTFYVCQEHIMYILDINVQNFR